MSKTTTPLRGLSLFAKTCVLSAVLVLAALAVPDRGAAQAPTFNTLITTFKGAPDFAHPVAAAVGDFNGDGKLDSAVIDGTSTIHVLLGNGAGSFAEHRVDIPLITASNAVGLSPSFGSALPHPIDGVIRAIKAVDVNGDGKLDIVCLFVVHLNFAPLWGTTVLINAGNDANGVPQFTPATHYFSPFADLRSLTIGDLNSDGKPDFIVGSANGALLVYLNNGDGTFTAGLTSAMSLQPGTGGPAVGPGVIADLNGDGKADFLVSSNQNHATNIFFGNGDGTFQATPAIIPSAGMWPVVADVNNDGKPDFLEVDFGSLDPSSGKLMVYLNNGDGTFSGPTLHSTGLSNPDTLAIADMNGDGHRDVVTSDFSSNSGANGVAVLLGNGDGTFGTPNLYNVNAKPFDLSVGDFNGDGKLDIGTVGFNDDTFGVLLNTTVPPGPPQTNWVNWTGIETVGGVTKYVGQMVVPRTGGGSTTVIVKYTPPNQLTDSFSPNTPGIAFIQTSGGTDYWASGPAGSLGRLNPLRSPYTSSKVINIPDGGGGANDKNDIIALRYAGTNTLEFTDASTGLPISIASPVFAYVSLNGNGYGFDQDFDILSFGDGTVRDQGYFGPGTSFKSTAVVGGATQYQLLGTGEPHGALQFRGSFSTVTWQSLSSEFWNGFTIGVAQLAADVPIANAGPDQTVTATSSNGASVQLSGSVSGSTKTPFTFTWTGPFGTASGQNLTVTLPVGTNTITLKVTDNAGASDTDTVVVTVLPAPADTTPPVITAPANITAEATSAAGAAVTFSATAVDNVDGPVAVSCTPASGSTFPLGATSVTCSASDAHHNTATKSFNVTVVDTTPPVITVPGNLTAEATGPGGAVVTYTASATDLVDGAVPVTCTPLSGATFALGTTPVSCSATDANGNRASGNFSVTVRDTTPPVITVPANQVLEATSAAGAVAIFTATATDNVGVTSLTYSSASGSTFPIGTTTVTVTAKDAAGNTSTGSFTITVRDTTPPVITSVTPSQASLWPPNHRMVSITVAVQASDLVDGAEPASACRIVSATSSEPDNGLGDGDQSGDIVLRGGLTVDLRAERSGTGNGRTYTLNVTCTDGHGNTSQPRATVVVVPHDQGKR